MSATFKDIGVSSEGHVGIVEIQRPPHNFFDNSLINQIADAFEAFDRDGNIRAYVLCAQGKSFCAGADFANRPQTGAAESGKHLYKEATRLFRAKKPSVGAIQGPAIGGGLGLAVMTDFRVTCAEGRFAANFTRLGFHPGFSLTYTLPRLIGQQRANLMFYTGRRIGGEEAVAWGLADVLVPLADVRKGALDLAKEIAESAPLALLSTRETMRRGFADAAEVATERELTEQDWTRKTEDFKEGVKSYAEKRAGNFKGPLMGQVSGKAAIVTGGASGIGEACSETLAREGASVLVTDVDDALGKAVVERITKAGGKARYLHHDVRDEAAWPGVIAEAEKNFGRLDIMVANAGIGVAAPIETMALADWQRQQAINLDGVFLSIKHAIPALRRAGGGSIVLMSSIAGLRGAPGLAAYSATKGGVRLLAKSVALEHAADNIRCNSVHPGIIATPIWGKIPTGAMGNMRNAPIDPVERSAAMTPLVRVGEAQDIANGVLFLCTEAANYMTGQELVIDGGITAGGRPQPRQQ